MPGEGRDLSSRQTQYVVKDMEIGQPIKVRNVFRNCRWRCTRKKRRDVLSESRMREICMSGCVSSEGWHVQQETNLPGEKSEPRSVDSRGDGNVNSEAY